MSSHAGRKLHCPEAVSSGLLASMAESASDFSVLLVRMLPITYGGCQLVGEGLV